MLFCYQLESQNQEPFSHTNKIHLLQQNKKNISLTQDIASLFAICFLFAYPSMYATLVCVACSQLEKLRATLLDIGQTHTTQPSCGAETDQHEGGGQTHASEEQFRHMQKQLNSCILLHQEIKRYASK
jgi:hypothetical protein